MASLFLDFAGSAASNVVQLLAGCILSVPLYLLVRGRAILKDGLSVSGLLFAIILSICGILLPLGIYGVIPLAAVLLIAGFRPGAVFPLLVSNIMFNMLVPFNDPSFIWRTGFRQIILAFAAGILTGVVASIPGLKGQDLIRNAFLPRIREYPSKIKMMAAYADDSFKKLGPFLLAGAAADLLFHRYVLEFAVMAFYYTPFTASIPAFFSGYNVVSPTFLLTFKIVYMILNLVSLSALSAILKPRGVVMYIVYFSLMAAILALPTFI